MLLTWLNRLLFILLVALGVLFSLENRTPITLSAGGLTFTAKTYIVVVGGVIVGFVLGITFSWMDRLTKQVKKRLLKAND